MGELTVKKVILGSIPDDFAPEKHLPLGPWCFIGREDVFPGWEDLDFEPDPYPTSVELIEASSKTCAYTNRILPTITARLNEENGVSYSDNFWRILLMPWLVTLIQTTWERQERITQFVEKYREIPLGLELLENDQEWNFENTGDFINRGVLHPIYNEWLYSRFLERLAPPSWKLIFTRKPFPQVERRNDHKAWLKKCLRKIRSISRCQSVYGISRFESLVWSLLLHLRPDGKTRPKPDNSAESKAPDLSWVIDFQALLDQTIPTNVREVANVAMRIRNKESRKINLVGPVLFFEDEAKQRLAARVELGERIVPTQHGGNYGTLKSIPLISEVEYKQSVFISWGWKKQGDSSKKVLDLPSPYLSRWRDYSPSTDHLIFVSGYTSLLSFRLDTAPQALQYLRQRKERLLFLQKLQERIVRSTRYRPYPDDRGGLQDKGYFEKKFPDLKFADDGYDHQLRRSRLVVIDYPVTVLNIALSINVPLVGFWNQDAWTMCEQAEPYFLALEEAGVIFRNGTDAAARVNNIWDDARSWWSQETIQKARRAWCEQYARTSPRWRHEWLKALWKL